MSQLTKPTINDFVLNVATVNGSGSQSSNQIILKSLFRMGLPVGGKNLFPSNIAGLPTWFTIRVNKNGFTGRKIYNDIVIAMNAATVKEDVGSLKKDGIFIYNQDLKFPPDLLRKDVQSFGVPFRKLVDQVTDSIKLKKLLTNMVYVGIIAELLKIEDNVLLSSVRDQFKGKSDSVIEVNQRAIDVGRLYAREHMNPTQFPYRVEQKGSNVGKIIIDGNTSAALGMVFGGCTFVTWYPITPSSSLVETFIEYADKYRQDQNGKNTFAVIQAEDEISALGMVVGASWAGARAMTSTSGPGLSLMNEFAGFSYFAEVPSVVWDIQRVGPSTGLPTRTQQSDILSAYHLSHGDTQHLLLIPASPAECFEFGQSCFDLAERLQTLVIVLSDLDLGMNLWVENEFQAPTKPFDRGKVLTADDVDRVGSFMRYKDVDGDAIPYRTRPGTRHEKAPYFTRGSGHNENAKYTESSPELKKLMDRLKRKHETAKQYMPEPITDNSTNATIGIIAFGSTDMCMAEARDQLKKAGVETNYLRLRAVPFHHQVGEFLEKNECVYVVEQNRDGQMKQLLITAFPERATQIHSVLHYDGLPIYADFISETIIKEEFNRV